MTCKRKVAMFFIFFATSGLGSSAWAQQKRAPDIKLTNCTEKSPSDTVRVPLIDSTAPARWAKEAVAAVKRRELCVGMNMDMLRKSWGFPSRIQSTTSAATGDTTAQFYYHGHTVILVNNIVRAIRPPDPGRVR